MLLLMPHASLLFKYLDLSSSRCENYSLFCINFLGFIGTRKSSQNKQQPCFPFLGNNLLSLVCVSEVSWDDVSIQQILFYFGSYETAAANVTANFRAGHLVKTHRKYCRNLYCFVCKMSKIKKKMLQTLIRKSHGHLLLTFTGHMVFGVFPSKND